MRKKYVQAKLFYCILCLERSERNEYNNEKNVYNFDFAADYNNEWLR